MIITDSHKKCRLTSSLMIGRTGFFSKSLKMLPVLDQKTKIKIVSGELKSKLGVEIDNPQRKFFDSIII